MLAVSQREENRRAALIKKLSNLNNRSIDFFSKYVCNFEPESSLEIFSKFRSSYLNFVNDVKYNFCNNFRNSWNSFKNKRTCKC
jgi:hypothetical protein